jgi:hypothetical protein
VLVARGSLLAKEPAKDTSGDDHDHNDGIPDNGLEDCRCSGSRILGDMRNGW